MIITLLRKPLEGSVANNALKHGCGAINIDATRIPASDNLNGGDYAENPTERGGQDMWTSTRKGDSNCFRRGGAGDYEQPTGRWPANFILTHLDGCEIKGTKKVKSGTAYQDKRAGINHVYSANLGPNVKGKAGYADEEGKEEVADWACVEGCPVIELDEISLTNGMHSAGSIRPPSIAPFNPKRKSLFGMEKQGYIGVRYGDQGGASRFFKQFKKESNQ